MKSESIYSCLIFLLIIALQIHGSIYYVSPSGNNTDPGTSQHPWAAPGYGSKQISGGDTLIIQSGDYHLSVFWDDMITPPSGSAANWTVIQGEAGSRPVLSGSNNLFSAIDLSNGDYIKITNLEICSDNGAFFREGVTSWDPASHITLHNLDVHHIDGMAVNMRDIQNLKIDSCRFSYCAFGCIGGPAGASGGWRYVTFSACTLSYSGHYYQGVIQSGVSPYDRPDGFGIEPSEGPVEISDCCVMHNRGDGLDSKAARTFIHHCIVANNTCDGIKLWGDSSRVQNCLIYGTGDGDASSPWSPLVIDNIDEPGYYFEILNTTIHDNPARPAYPMYVQYSGTGELDLVMKNNIISNGHGVVYFGDPVNLTAEYNCFYRPGETIQVTADGQDYTDSDINQGNLGTGNLVADPLFESPAWGTEGDYHLRPASPAIDAGYWDCGIPNTDLEYRSRPLGDSIDLGAFEFKPVVIQISAFLEGAFSSQEGGMTFALCQADYLTTHSPYPEDPRQIDIMPVHITDWMLVQLRKSINGPAVVSKSVLIRKDGFLVTDNGLSTQITLNCEPGLYYLVLTHRNHLSVMSADPVDIQ
ncbi:right-handed parallel beta-helix repeat-containing protein [bacterium]|nr:right-handed parallel beta-helix repeat-containing protein [bacterium]